MRLPSRKKAMSMLIILFSSCLFSAALFPAAEGPKIKFNEELWDFGKTKEGKVLSHIFVLKNTGDAPLLIKRVTTSCGCAAALVSDKEVLPGREGEIKVTLNTRGYSGEISKFIQVESNDSAQPQIQLTVSAAIDVPPRPKIELDSYSLDLGLILESEEIQVRTKVKNKGELELEVELNHREASFFNGGKKISSPLKIAAGKEEEIEIKIPARKGAGLIREYILMKSNDPMRPNLSLYLSGYIITKKQLVELFNKYKHILK